MMKNLLIRISATIAITTALTSCSGNYGVSTNLDKENFTEYFSASKVTIYQKEHAIPGPYKFISAVEGEDCQLRPHHAAPDKINARTHARQQAFLKNANAIVFSGCAELNHEQLAKLKETNDAKQCHAIVVCYGRAFSSKPQ